MSLNHDMRNKLKPILFMFSNFIKNKRLILRFFNSQPVSSFFGRRLISYNGRRAFLLRVRPPFRKFKFNSFIRVKPRGSKLKTFFSKTKKRK